MENHLNPDSQNRKLNRVRWPPLLKIAKIRSISSNFGMEHQWNISIQNYKNEKNLVWSFVLFTSVILLNFPCLIITYLNNFKQLVL